MTKEDEHLSSVVAAAVSETIKQQNGGRATPKTWIEAAWKAADTFGIPAVILGVLLLIAYQTLPAWIQASIKTQESLSENLDKQTGIFERQVETQEAIADSVEKIDASTASIMVIEEEAKVFMVQNQEEHKVMLADHKRQMEEHQVEVEKLTDIESKLPK